MVSVCETRNSKVEASPGGLLLGFASRFRLTPEESSLLLRAASEATGEEWAEVEGEAFYRRTAALLCHHLREAGFEPSGKLRREYSETAHANMMFEAELRRIAPLFREAGIRILLIKGTALHHAVYQNPGIRPFEDSDWVLANMDDAAEAGRVLQRIGYEAFGEEASPKWIRGPFTIEFHRNFLGDERIAARTSGLTGPGEDGEAGGQVWGRARPSPFGEPYLIPAPEDHLIILCAHLMKHNFEPGIWFTDLEALLTELTDFDWEAVLSRARSWGLLRSLAFAFRNFGALKGEEDGYGPSIPLRPESRRALESVRPTSLDRVLLALAAKGGRLTGEKEEWGQAPIANLLWLSSLKRPGDKLRLLWEAAFPRGEVMAEIYPSYRSASRWWFMLRRAVELVRLGVRLIQVAWAAERKSGGRR